MAEKQICPWCGSKMSRAPRDFWYQGDPPQAWHECMGCGHGGVYVVDESEGGDGASHQ